MAIIDITGLDKAELLARLYNAAKHIDMEGDQEVSPNYYMQLDVAKELLAKQTSFGDLKERMINMDFSGDTIRTDLYNRDNGKDAAEAVVDALRKDSRHGGLIGGVQPKDVTAKPIGEHLR